jgi:hypothetical protein
MNDDQSTDSLLRASAYLDGELAADEAAAVESDPDLMAEVDRLRDMREAIRDVEPSAAYARDRAIAAALAEFDTVHQATQRSTPVVAFRPRPAYAKWLGVAAAVVGVGLLGVLLANVDVGGDDSDEAAVDVAEATAEEAVQLEAPPAAAEGGADSEAARTAADDADAGAIAADAAGDAAAEEMAPMLAEATEAPAATDAPSAAPEATAFDQAGSGGAPATTALSARSFDPSRPIADAAELAAVGQLLRELEAAGQLPPAPDSTCFTSASSPVEVVSNGVYMQDRTPTPVLIAIDRTEDITVAVLPDDCRVIATGR